MGNEASANATPEEEWVWKDGGWKKASEVENTPPPPPPPPQQPNQQEVSQQPNQQEVSQNVDPNTSKNAYDSGEEQTLLTEKVKVDDGLPYYQEPLPDFPPPFVANKNTVKKSGRIRNKKLYILALIAIIFHFGFWGYFGYLAFTMYNKVSDSTCSTTISGLVDTQLSSGSGDSVIKNIPDAITSQAGSLAKAIYSKVFYWIITALVCQGCYFFIIVWCLTIYLYDTYWVLAKTFSFNFGYATRCMEKIFGCGDILSMHYQIILHGTCTSWYFIWKSSDSCVVSSLSDYQGTILFLTLISTYNTAWAFLYFIIFLVIGAAYRKGQYGETMEKTVVDEMDKKFKAFQNASSTKKKMKEVKDRGDQEVVDLPWEMYDIDNNLEIRHTKLTDKYSLPVKELNDILVPMGLMNDKFYTEKTSQIHTMIVTKMRAKQYEAGTCITELKFCCKFLIYPHLVFYTISCQASFGVFVLLCINQTDTIGMIVWAGQTIPSSLIMLIFWCVKKGVKYPYGAPEDLIEYDKLVDFITKERKRIEAENLARKLAWEEQQRQNCNSFWFKNQYMRIGWKVT